MYAPYSPRQIPLWCKSFLVINLFMILMIHTISLCGLCETNSTGVDVVHVMDRGALWLCSWFFVLQDLRDGLHRSRLSWFNLPAFRLDGNGNRTQIRSPHKKIKQIAEHITKKWKKLHKGKSNQMGLERILKVSIMSDLKWNVRMFQSLVATASKAVTFSFKPRLSNYH